jgi:hypothetical protein
VKSGVKGSCKGGCGRLSGLWLWLAVVNNTVDLCSRYNVCLEGGALVQATPRTTST